MQIDKFLDILRARLEEYRRLNDILSYHIENIGEDKKLTIACKDRYVSQIFMLPSINKLPDSKDFVVVEIVDKLVGEFKVSEFSASDDKIEQIVSHYRFENQRDIASEECAEYIQAVSKCRRYANDYKKYEEYFENLKEETADVLIMMLQMREYLGKAEIDGIVEKKLNRQLVRMKNE